MEYQQKSARLPRSAEDKEKWKRVIIILEHCPLQSVQTERGRYELLSEKHRRHHAKYNQDPAEWRPDVVHQCLLHLQDSPLNRAGLLQVFLRTKRGVCIMVDPRLRVPRHMRLFEKMMVQLFFKMKVRSSTGYLTLLREIKNPITEHVPANVEFIRVEKDGEMVSPFALAEQLGYASRRHKNHNDKDANNNNSSSSDNNNKKDQLQQMREDKAEAQFRPFAFVVGGMSKGDVEAEYAPKEKVRNIKVADRGMSAAAVLSLLLHGFEEAWLKEDNNEV